MTLVVENGTGQATAESYESLAAAATYHLAHGNDAWRNAASDRVRENALRRATTWIDATYRFRFPGYRLTGRTQALEWPRTHVVDGSGLAVSSASVPPEIKRATCEAALRELLEPGTLIAPLPSSGVYIKRERVDVIEREYGGDGKPVSSAAATASTASTAIIDGYLEPILLPRVRYLLRA